MRRPRSDERGFKTGIFLGKGRETKEKKGKTTVKIVLFGSCSVEEEGGGGVVKAHLSFLLSFFCSNLSIGPRKRKIQSAEDELHHLNMKNRKVGGTGNARRSIILRINF